MSLKGFRSRVASFFLGTHKEKPIIMTKDGPVTEAARMRAAMNMKEDPLVREKVEAVLAKQFGSLAKGLIESKRRYPEAYED